MVLLNKYPEQLAASEGANLRSTLICSNNTVLKYGKYCHDNIGLLVQLPIIRYNLATVHKIAVHIYIHTYIYTHKIDELEAPPTLSRMKQACRVIKIKTCKKKIPRIVNTTYIYIQDGCLVALNLRYAQYQLFYAVNSNCNVGCWVPQAFPDHHFCNKEMMENE